MGAEFLSRAYLAPYMWLPIPRTHFCELRFAFTFFVALLGAQGVVLRWTPGVLFWTLKRSAAGGPNAHVEPSRFQYYLGHHSARNRACVCLPSLTDF